jgi:hypothetical protein
MVGILLYKRKNRVEFLVDDLQFANKFDHYVQIKIIVWILKSLKNFKIKYLSSFTSDIITTEESIEIEKLSFANSIHKNRGEEDTQPFKKMVTNNVAILKRNFLNVKGFINENKDCIYVVPGGIYGNSGLFEKTLRRNNISYFTFDSFFSVLITCYKGIAAQFTDIPMALNLLLNDNKKDQEKAIAYANDEFEKRRNGTNKLNSQYQSFEQSENFDNVGILMPLNSPWDSAALNIGSVFSTYNAWLLETVGMILENSDFNVTIRQHPDERLWWGKTKTDFKNLLNLKFNNNKRIQFVSCFDKVNTYALLENSKAVICFSSTFGIEASMAGKLV